MDKIIFFTILTVFPFGQLFKVGIFNLFDIAVLLLAMVTLWRKPKYPSWYRYFIYFISSCLFSWILNYFIFGSPIFIKGLFYLLRLLAYSYIAIYIFNFVKDKKFVVNSLLSVSVFSAVFGWLQYFIWPDLTTLKYLGWDDHLLRMVGTFLDPTYLALIIILGIIIAVLKNNKKLLYFLLISLAFTYSRSSYLIASLFLIYKRKYLGLIVFAVTILFLPKMIGEGTNLVRSSTTNLKIKNYTETINIIDKSPAFGVGFNNICAARSYYLNDTNLNSHACNGSDSSILFILATTGIIGLILFISFVVRIPANNILVFSFIAVLIHSIFANSLFYPHIMFWLFCLVGLVDKTKSAIE